MASPSVFVSWYTAPKDTSKSDLARGIFNETLTAFKTELSKDKTKLKWILDSRCSSLSDVLAFVAEARVQYEARKGDSNIRENLCELTEKIHHYGAIMDVMVQHHPEYTSLAWGAMKVLFVGVVNQQNLLSRLSTGLCQIADHLPRAELILDLYPTERVKHAIVAMYAHILRFLLRALRWYQESKLSHMVHAITRPAELRYDDLLEKISFLSRNITEWALVISHAEQRDLHGKVQQHLSAQNAMQLSIGQLTTLVLQIKESLVTESVLSASARIEVRQTLSEIQLSQFLAFLSANILLDAERAFQGSVFLRNRRRGKGPNTGRAFWLNAKIQFWNRCQSSSLVIIKGTHKQRFHVKDFCVDSVSILRKTQIPVIWALKAMDVQNSVAAENKVSTIVLLKHLITQAIQINSALHTDAGLAPRLKAWLGASTEAEWLGILASALQGIPIVYIIIDIELLDHSLAELTESFLLPAAFLQLFSQMAQRGIKTVIKVALVSYGSPVFKQPMSNECQKLVVPVVGAGSCKKSARMPLRGGRFSNRGRGGARESLS